MARITDSLDGCKKLLEEHCVLIEGCLRRGHQQDDPQAVMLLRTFDFGVRTSKAMKAILESDGQNGLLACTLCRAFFEAAVRVLWASRTLPQSQNPWARLQVYWAKEDIKWAHEAKDFPDVAAHAENIRQARQKVLDQKDDEGEDIRSAPPILQMLREIEQADTTTGLRDVGRKDADYTYVNVYRLLCQPAHGHLVTIGNTKPGAFLAHARTGFAMATFWLLQACCHVGAADPEVAIEGVAAQIIEILKKKHND